MRTTLKTFATLLCMLPLSTQVLAASPRVSVTMSAFDDNFLTVLRSAIAQQAATDGVKVQFEDGKNDVSKQSSQIDNFISSQPDAIIINPVDSTGVLPISQNTADADIPLVYVNREPINIKTLPPYQAFVGSSEIEGGTLEANEVCRLLHGKGNVLIMQGDLSQQSAILRTKAVEEVFKRPDCNGIKVVDKQIGKWTRTGGNDLMANWLSTNVKFDAVIANNDEMALGAIQALKASGRDMKSVVVAGIDATDDAVAAMKAGDLAVTVFQDAKAQGRQSLQVAEQLIKAKQQNQPTAVPKSILIPYTLVTPATVNQYPKK
ncbi:sugar ABC transporter substrate-binding protein [Candidatus Pantoea multigeneris]|uniref:Sugar ABC transporter substrate-binding protein n=1 Tax=Candidatus Pantoea multigeneris TaxID=2608357 RepID=A0ABX0RET1_9GAMM|nr:sugar ABC transporter substrate-binding protein [Pantoea multigeneris]NIF22179.1 sugar ABC transporter substrate-binding protein [Pantoea multigeneris]